MSKATDFINALVAEAKAKSGNVCSAYAEFNGKLVIARITRVNTNSKSDVCQVRYTVNRKVVSAAKIIETIES